MFASNTSQVSSDAVYVEDVFSNFLYTGNGSTQTINNGIDLSGKGGLVWIKKRDSNIANTGHILEDTQRGANYYLSTNSTNAESYEPQNFSFNSDGFSMDVNNLTMNYASSIYASWTFRKAPKFFDVVTYTGDGSTSPRAISHSLGQAPGMIMFKATNSADNWVIWHRGVSTSGFYMGTGAASATIYNEQIGAQATSSSFYVQYATGSTNTNNSGTSYVAYLFAHNAGGFGLTGTDNVISCGSYTGSSSDVSINLGYEAQWVMVKNVSRSGTNWQMLDIMRGMPLAGNAKTLAPNLSDAESSPTAPVIVPTATGMTITGGLGYAINYNGDSYIYIAIRRGPMKTPTSGTSVFAPVAYSGTGANNSITSAGFPPDMFFSKIRQSDNGYQNMMFDRLRGAGQYLIPTSTDAEGPSSNIQLSFDMSGVTLGAGNNANGSGSTYADYFFRRAPGFFDEVCVTGDGTSNRAIKHSLTIPPEMVVWQSRNNGGNWRVYHKDIPNAFVDGIALNLSSAAGGIGSPATAVSSSTFTAGVNLSGYTYVAYLFASCPGVSKCTAFTGTGALQTIDCGFTGGARFVLIKRTDSTGDWYVWDSSRGLSSSNDPYLLLNSTAAEVTSTNWVDTTSTGFQVTAASGNNVNINGASYIALAIS